MRKKIVTPRNFVKPPYSLLIEKTRDGSEFTEDEIRFLVDSVLDQEIPDYQLASLLMSIFFVGMSAQETAIFLLRKSRPFFSINGIRSGRHWKGW